MPMEIGKGNKGEYNIGGGDNYRITSGWSDIHDGMLHAFNRVKSRDISDLRYLPTFSTLVTMCLITHTLNA